MKIFIVGSKTFRSTANAPLTNKRKPKGEIMEKLRNSVIFAPIGKAAKHFKHKVRVIHIRIPIEANLKLHIPGKYWFEGAYRVYDPYTNQDKFLTQMAEFAKVSDIDSFYYVKDDKIYLINTSDLSVQPSEVRLITDNVRTVGYILGLVLANALKAYPELEHIYKMETIHFNIE